MTNDLDQLIERHKENLRVLWGAHPNPAQELDDFVRKHFDPEILFELAQDEEVDDFDNEELNGL